jgi:hypothetical protein
MIFRRFWNVKGFPSPGGQSRGMFSTSPRLCQSVFLCDRRSRDRSASVLTRSVLACGCGPRAASGLTLDGVT